MNTYVQNLNETNELNISDVGGKALNLIKMSRIDGIEVPEAFCITTESFKETYIENIELSSLINQLSNLKVDEKDRIKSLCNQIREAMENVQIPQAVSIGIEAHLKKFNDETPYAVRSSATAEDLPTASFAGQHDSYLNIIGLESITRHIIKCWASLFTERAVMYRMQNGFDHRNVYIAVVIQKMVLPQASGIMFTADPVSGNRNMVSIDASYGIGEALVSGIVNPDTYKVKKGKIVHRKISSKNMAIYPIHDGGTEERGIEDKHKREQTLADGEILKLEELGRKIEAHFSNPQDIEWCLFDKKFYFVQSRPITTLYPAPQINEGENHIFMSVGHMQMMTDPVKPLGIYFLKTFLEIFPSQEIGGRLYADITHDLAAPLSRVIFKKFVGMVGDDLITDAITQIINNKKLIKALPKGKEKILKPDNNSGVFSILHNAYRIFKKNDPDIFKGLIRNEDNAIERMKEEINALSGDEVFNYICNDHHKRRQKIASPSNAGALTAVLLSEKWLSKKVEKWLGIKKRCRYFSHVYTQ